MNHPRFPRTLAGGLMCMGAAASLSGYALAADPVDANPEPVPPTAVPAGTAAPAIPELSEVLKASGITAAGYIDATYAYGHEETGSRDYNSFVLQQAALTISRLPTSGLGAMVNVIAGQNPYAATGYASIAPGQGSSATNFYLLQAYAQYAAGQWLVQAGKFSTLAGAEVAAPTLNTNTTRSLLFAYEPVTHTGVRLTYGFSDAVSFIVGLNNGWTASQDTATGSPKVVEMGASWAPSKAFSWTAQTYYGRDFSSYTTLAGDPIRTGEGIFDTVLTWNASSAVTLVGSVDYGWIDSTGVSPSASWYGVAGYLNYAWNPLWRTSLRAEYLSDSNGYLTQDFRRFAAGRAQSLQEVTLTVGWSPVSHVELRVEGRHDAPGSVDGLQLQPRTDQAWLEGLLRF